MLTKEELLILGVAAIDDHGEYCLCREYNVPWSEQYAAIKLLEDLGFMKIKSAGRVLSSQQYVCRSVITDAGRAALAATPQVRPSAQPSLARASHRAARLAR
jgi:hypothetical protein